MSRFGVLKLPHVSCSSCSYGIRTCFVLLKQYLTLPSVFHHNRNNPQSLSLAVWITRIKCIKGYLTVTGAGKCLEQVSFCHCHCAGCRIAPQIHDGQRNQQVPSQVPWEDDQRDWGGMIQNRVLTACTLTTCRF